MPLTFADVMAADARALCEAEFSEPFVYCPAGGAPLALRGVLTRQSSPERGREPQRGVASFGSVRLAASRLADAGVVISQNDVLQDAVGVEWLVDAWVVEHGVATLRVHADRRAAL